MSVSIKKAIDRYNANTRKKEQKKSKSKETSEVDIIKSVFNAAKGELLDTKVQKWIVEHFEKHGSNEPYVVFEEYDIINHLNIKRDSDSYKCIVKAAESKKHTTRIDITNCNQLYENCYLELTYKRKPVTDPEWHFLGFYMLTFFLWDHYSSPQVQLVYKKPKKYWIF